MSRSMLFPLYTAVWRAAAPLLRRHTRLAQGFDRRQVPEDWPCCPPKANSLARTIWIQAASGGEARLVSSLAEALCAVLAEQKDQFPYTLRLLCTSCTDQGLEVLRKVQAHHASVPESPVDIAVDYFPLDSPPLMRRAVQAAAPEAVVLLETELWPGLLAAAKDRDVPVLLLNARMTEKSFRNYRLLRFFLQAHAPRRIVAVSPEDAARFQETFGPGATVGCMPNIKFDGVVVPDAYAGGNAAAFCRAVEQARASLGFGPDLLAPLFASVREEEENLLLPRIVRLARSAPAVVPVVAPRHMHRIAWWRARLEQEGFRLCLRSAGAVPAPEAGLRAVVWDTFGELDAAYLAADAVAVGGGFAPLGGQNFLEPLCLGHVPIVGRHLRNFAWVGEGLFDQGLAVRVDGPEALYHRMRVALGLAGSCSSGSTEGCDSHAGLGAHDTSAGTAGGSGDLAGRAGHAGQSASDSCRGLPERLRGRVAVQKQFALWLRGRRGGSLQAARCVLDALTPPRG